MAYELLTNGPTQFAIDWTVVRRLLKSYYTAVFQYAYGRETSLSDSHWYNPMSWSLPEVTHIEVDWDAVRTDAEARGEDDLRNMRTEAVFNAARVARRLEAMVEDTAVRKVQFSEWMGAVQSQNVVAIDKAVETYESNVEIARMVRDASADGLMVGASVMTGGAAVAALGGASFAKGACKFQDSGSVGAGAMEATGSFLFAYVKLGKKFSFRDEMVLAFVQAPYKSGTELVAGKSFTRAIALGGVKLVAPGVDHLLKLGPARTLFDRITLPVVISYGGKDVAAQLLPKAAATAIKKGIEAGVKGASSSASAAPTGRTGHGHIVGNATISDKFLLDLAFVNMTKGIGHRW